MEDKRYINHLAHLALIANSDGMDEHHDSIVGSVAYLRRYIDSISSEHKAMQNKIEDLEKFNNSLATYNCRTCGHNIVEQGFNMVHNHTETCSNCYRCNNWIAKGGD